MLSRWFVRVSVVVVLMGIACGVTARAQAPLDAAAIDDQRAERYLTSLQSIQRRRDGLAKECEELGEREGELRAVFESESMRSRTEYANFLATPPVTAIPFLQRVVTRDEDEPDRPPRVTNRLFYALQDNTWMRQQLLSASYTSHLKSRQALEAWNEHVDVLRRIAAKADELFIEYRSRVDWTGRRSAEEHQRVLVWATQQAELDDSNAGLALMEAAAMRVARQNDEALDRMDRLDDLFPPMIAMHALLKIQLEYLQGESKRAMGRLVEGSREAAQYRVTEWHLVHGWILMAEGEPVDAQQAAKQALDDGTRDLEAATLLAWSLVDRKKPKAKEALEVLRRVAAQASADDWDYYEAMGAVQAHLGDWPAASDAYAKSLATAPSHVRGDLEATAAAVGQQQLPVVPWEARLRSSWQARP